MVAGLISLRETPPDIAIAFSGGDNFSIESGIAQRLRQSSSFSEAFKSPVLRFSTPEISHIFVARALGKSPEREVLTSLSGVSFAKFSNI